MAAIDCQSAHYSYHSKTVLTLNLISLLFSCTQSTIDKLPTFAQLLVVGLSLSSLLSFSVTLVIADGRALAILAFGRIVEIEPLRSESRLGVAQLPSKVYLLSELSLQRKTSCRVGEIVRLAQQAHLVYLAHVVMRASAALHVSPFILGRLFQFGSIHQQCHPFFHPLCIPSFTTCFFWPIFFIDNLQFFFFLTFIINDGYSNK